MHFYRSLWVVPSHALWLLVGWFFSWTSYGAAVVFGSVFAVSSSIVLVKVITKANLRQWVADMKAAGFPGFLRKLIKPLPFPISTPSFSL